MGVADLAPFTGIVSACMGQDFRCVLARQDRTNKAKAR